MLAFLVIAIKGSRTLPRGAPCGVVRKGESEQLHLALRRLLRHVGNVLFLQKFRRYFADE